MRLSLASAYGCRFALDLGPRNQEPEGEATDDHSTAKSVKSIRVLVIYVSSPHKSQNFEIPVKIQ
jgi:hypothetical protein